MTNTAGASSCSFPYSAAQLRCMPRRKPAQQKRYRSAEWRALDSASVAFPLLLGRHSFFVIQLTGSKVDSAQPDVLGDPYDRRVWTRSNCHSHESPARLAMRLMTLMLALFGVMVWVPHLIAHPKAHFNWSECVLTFLVTGAAWVVANLKSF
jgi:hypothetical protein